MLKRPLPEGVAAPADARVKAQLVEDCSASLTEFALAAKDQSRARPVALTLRSRLTNREERGRAALAGARLSKPVFAGLGDFRDGKRAASGAQD